MLAPKARNRGVKVFVGRPPEQLIARLPQKREILREIFPLRAQDDRHRSNTIQHFR